MAELTVEQLQGWLKNALTERDTAQAASLKTLVSEATSELGTSVTELSKRMDDLDAALKADSRVQDFSDAVDERSTNVLELIQKDYGVQGLTEEKLKKWGETYDVAKALDGYTKGWPRHLQQKYQGEYVLTHMATEKAQLAEVDTGGGFAIPSVHMGDRIIPALEAQIIASRLGAVTEDGFGGSPVDIPAFDSIPDAQWVSEIQSADDQSFSMRNVRMTPHGCTSLIPFSNRLLRMAPNLRNSVQGLMVRALARKLDAAVFNGTGATGTPLGMKNTGGINSESWSGFSVGFADQDVTTHLENMIGKLEDADAYMGSLGWAMSPATRRCLMRAVDANNRPLFFSTRGLGSAPNGEAGAGTGRGPGSGEFYGHPYATSTQLAGGAAGDLIFADFSTVLIGMFSTIIVETSREAGDAFRTNQTLVKAYMEADIGIQHAEAICIANSLATTTVAA